MATSISMEQFRKRFEVPPGNQPLSNGYFSEVFLVNDLHIKAEVVLKIVRHGGDPRLKPSGCLRSRIEKVDHPNLFRFHAHYIVAPTPGANGEAGFEVFVSEHIADGNVDHLLKNGVSHAEAARMIHDTINALDTLHAHRIVHGKLKPSNMLIENVGHPNIRLTDYGLVTGQSYRDAPLTFPEGSLSYLAPEQLLGQKVSRNVDFWALGMVAYELFTGKYLFGDQFANNSIQAAYIKSADLPKDIANIPAPFAAFVSACLIRNPKLRPKHIATLRRILDGKVTWVEGKEIPVAKPTPPDRYCNTCGTINAPSEITCTNCDKALAGPAFLQHYRPVGPRSFWAILFLGFFLLPVGFLFVQSKVILSTAQITSQDHVSSELINVCSRCIQKIQAAINQEGSVRKNFFGNDCLIALYLFLTGMIWALLQLFWTLRVSNNLKSLGSYGRRIHPLWSIFFFPTIFVLQDIWRGSNPAYLKEGYSWKSAKPSFMITTWWLLSIIAPILFLMPNWIVVPKDLADIWFYLTISILIAYIVLYIAVLVRINYRQSAKYYAWAQQGGVVSRRP